MKVEALIPPPHITLNSPNPMHLLANNNLLQIISLNSWKKLSLNHSLNHSLNPSIIQHLKKIFKEYVSDDDDEDSDSDEDDQHDDDEYDGDYDGVSNSLFFK